MRWYNNCKSAGISCNHLLLMLEKTNMTIAPKAIINAITTLYNEKEYDEVLSRTSRLLLKYPHTYALHNILGAIYFEKGDKEEALKHFKKVVDIRADNPHGYNNLGATLIDLKEYKEALLVFKRAIKFNPNYAEAYNNIGIVYQELNRYSQAIDNYNKAIKLKPDYYEAYNNMGVALCKNKKYEKAEKVLKKVIKMKPQFLEGFNSLANILIILKKFKEAEKLIKNVIKKNPKLTDSHNILGNVLINLHKYDEAELVLKESIKINPINKDAFYYLGDLFSRKQISKSAIKYFTKALFFDSENANIYYNLGVNFSKIGELKKASDNLKKSLQINPTNQIALHVYNSILGRKTKTAPRDYIVGIFDHYAKNFEQSLIDNLDYKIPRKIKNLLLGNSLKSLGSILDLGCGTGLVGYELRKHCKYLEGIDLSSNMIEEAKKKIVYDKLVQTEVIDYLKTKSFNFDYFIAADVFIYVGDLNEVFKLIKERNGKSGNLVFSTEDTDGNGYFLEKTGRYSHSKNYIKNLCNDFNCSIIEFHKTKIRKEKNDYVDGAIYNIKF